MTEDKATKMSPLDCAISLYNPNKQHQTNELRVAVQGAKSAGSSIANITQKAWAKYGASGWDGS
eukprot:9695473-Ditylum_brightwellii.AAC.1